MDLPPSNGDRRDRWWPVTRHSYCIMLACVFVAGAWLRLHLLGSQILLGDEWHGITAIAGKSYADVLTGFNAVINSSVPLNLYNLALYNFFGWSELSIRLPAILAGLLSLVALPVLIKQVIDERVSIVFACLLAISPFLVFYSRYERPYGVAALLCFSALLLARQWLATGKPPCAAGYIITGALAIYANLFSVVAVAVPIIAALGIYCVRRLRPLSAPRIEMIASFRAVLGVAAIIVVLLLPFLWPVLRRSSQLPWAMGNVTMDGAITAATLLSGTANLPLNVLFYLLLVAGCGSVLKRTPLLGLLFLLTACAYGVVLLVSRPRGLSEGAILLRYMIVVIPISLTAVAAALDGLLRRFQSVMWLRRGLPVLGAAGFVGCLYAAGPLPELNRAPNNLTNHAVFQSSYRRHAWESTAMKFVYPAFVIQQDQIPPFYNWLRAQPDAAAIVEYPFDVCDYNNILYYYQHFHQKRVLAGYCPDPALVTFTLGVPPEQLATPIQVGMLSVDQILSKAPDPKRFAFRNMVDVSDAAALVRSRADFLVMHKSIMALKLVSETTDAASIYDRVRVDYGSVSNLQARCREVFGTAVYDDAQLVCFQIRRPTSAPQK
jgi:hypothetical protein